MQQEKENFVKKFFGGIDADVVSFLIRSPRKKPPPKGGFVVIGYLPYPTSGNPSAGQRNASVARANPSGSREGQTKKAGHRLVSCLFGEPNVNYPNSILPVGDSFGFILKLY